MTTLSIILPTRDEADNVGELLSRIGRAVGEIPAEVVVVDDSDDGTPERVREASHGLPLELTLICRPPGERAGGLGGAVVAGMREARGDWVCVMDSDLQHPPELIPRLLERARETRSDLVMASRLTRGGSAAALGPRRWVVSRILALVSRALFPRRLRRVTDPMTGFFAVRRHSLRLDRLRPDGFKILLEILIRHRELRLAEVPLVFAVRNGGHSKAGLAEAVRLVRLMARLRWGDTLRLQRFLAVGASGFVVNNALLALFTELGDLHYLVSALLATQGSTLWNFGWTESWVFADRRERGRLPHRLALYLGINNVALGLRAPLMFVLTSILGVHYLVSNVLSIAALTAVRYASAEQWIWRQVPRVQEAAAPRAGSIAAPQAGSMAAPGPALARRIARGG